MKKLSASDIDHLARLANLPLTPAEENEYASSLTQILEHVQAISSLDLSRVPQTNQVTQVTNRLRPDEVKPSLSQAQALSQASSTHEGYFVVPRILSDV